MSTPTSTPTGRLWFGGVTGKKPGDIVLANAEGDSTRGTVLVTTERDYARQFAANAPDGDLYRVEPITGANVERADGHSIETYRVDAVKVTAVIERCVRFTDKDRRRIRRKWAAAVAADMLHRGTA